MAKLPIPFNNPYTYPGHSGVDFPQPRGTVFRASGPGVVTTRSRNDRGGFYIWVKYDSGPEVGYHHMDSHNGCPAVGVRVGEGSQLGFVGNTGNSTGPHLHSEVAGHATTDGYWRFFDRNRVVGSGVTANGKLVVDGDWGAATTSKLQSALGVTVDGILGPQTIAALQTRIGVTADGDMGPNTIRALQAKVGAEVDGVLGPRTVQALQNYLNNGGTFQPDGKLTVDGEWGPATTRAFQKSLGVAQDGELGPITWTAFQRAVGVTADGIPGPITISALQMNVGATVDGEVGPQTTRKLQEHLNAGKGWTKVTVPATPTEPTAGKVGRNLTKRPNTEIQEFLKAGGFYKGEIDGQYGAGMTAGVMAYQLSKYIDADGDWGIASDGLAFPPAGSTFGVDYSFARPDPKMLADRGVKVAGRYLWREKLDSGQTNKGISKAELAALRAAGIKVFFIYEEDGRELLDGRAGGVTVAQKAEAFLAALGESGNPIYFNVDFDADASQYPAILDALDGIASVIGLERTGLYAGYDVIAAAFNAGKITWGFQTYAWSQGRWDQRAQIQQWANGQWGGSVDFLRAVAPEYGQNAVETEPEPVDVTLPRTDAQEAYDAAKKIIEKLGAALA